MGATSIAEVFYDESFGPEPMGAREVFSRARSEAQYEFGVDRYNGTWSTLDGLIVDREHVPVPAKLAEVLAAKRFDRDEVEKWGPAHAIPVCADADAVTRTVKVTVTLTGDEYVTHGGGKRGRRAAVQAKLPKLLQMRAGEFITETKFGEWAIKSSVSESRRGEPTTVYTLILRGWGNQRVSLGDFSTLTAAKGAAREHLKKNSDDTSIEIEARRIRTVGPLLTLTKTVTTATVTVEVILMQPKVNAKRIGWYLYGLAAC